MTTLGAEEGNTIQNLTIDSTVLSVRVGRMDPGPSMQNRTYWNFSPGSDLPGLFGDGKTAVRGPALLRRCNLAVFSLTKRRSTGDTRTFKIRRTPLSHSSNASNCASVLSSNLANSIVTVDYHAGQPYNIQYNLTIQRNWIGHGISVAYVGSPACTLAATRRKSHDSDRRCDASNIGLLPFFLPEWQPSECRIIPNFWSVNTNNAVGVSYYDSFQVVVNKRLSSGLEAQGAYTMVILGYTDRATRRRRLRGRSGNGYRRDSNTRAYDTDHPALTFVIISHESSVRFRIASRTACYQSLSTVVDGNIVSLQTGLPLRDSG